MKKLNTIESYKHLFIALKNRIKLIHNCSKVHQGKHTIFLNIIIDYYNYFKIFIPYP